MLDQWLSVYFLQQLLDALTYLKIKGVLHEDIKGLILQLVSNANIYTCKFGPEFLKFFGQSDKCFRHDALRDTADTP